MTLHLPEGMNYSCVNCGRSCTMFTELPVDADSEATLATLPIEKELGITDPLVEKNGAKILRKECGSCVFLSEKKLCKIHEKFGAEKKPQGCRDFPFRYVETPVGTFLGASFACTAIQQNHGVSLLQQRESFEGNLPYSYSRLRAPELLRFDHRQEISHDVYTQIEERLLAFLQSTLSVREALGAQSVLLDLIQRALQTEAPLDAVWAALEQRYGGPQLPGIAELALRAQGRPALQRSFLGLLTGFRNQLADTGKRPSRFGASFRMLGLYGKNLFRIGKIDLLEVPQRFSHREFSRIEYDVKNPELEDLLRRYFIHAIFRKDLMIGSTVWLNHRFLVIDYALIRWYAVGLTAARGSKIVETEDLREAIGCVERLYGFHSRFELLFDRIPSLGVMLDGVVRKPAFVASMLTDLK